MKNFVPLFFMLSLLFSWGTRLSGQKYAVYYQEQVDSGATLLLARYQLIREKTEAGIFQEKIFYPETKTLTQFITYADKKFRTRQGPFREWYDDGRLWKEGSFNKGLMDGEWSFYDFNSGARVQSGFYQEGLKTGPWHQYDTLGRILLEENYLAGQLHGAWQKWNTQGELIQTREYAHGVLVTSVPADSARDIQDESFPLLGGCATLPITEEEKKQCSDKLLMQWIYPRLEYPEIARENDLTGIAYFQFTIDKTGALTHLRTMRGLCAPIEEQCRKALMGLPAWTPGQMGGEPVNVRFVFPIKFNLK